MSAGIEILRQINVIREVIDITKAPDQNSKGPFIGNYPVDIENPNEGDMIIFHNHKWRKITSKDFISSGDTLPENLKSNSLFYCTTTKILYFGLNGIPIPIAGEGFLNLSK